MQAVIVLGQDPVLTAPTIAHPGLSTIAQNDGMLLKRFRVICVPAVTVNPYQSVSRVAVLAKKVPPIEVLSEDKA